MQAWTGSRVRLRAWEPEDWEHEVRWSNDTEGQRLDFRVQFPRSEAAIRKQAEEFALKAPEQDWFRFIVAKLDGTAVGVLTVDDCLPANGTFMYGVYIEPENRRQGYASEAILLMLRYYFESLRYQKAKVNVYEFNEPSVRLHRKLGFVEEGRLRRMLFSGGAYHDEVRLGITVEEYREHHAAWLSLHRSEENDV